MPSFHTYFSIVDVGTKFFLVLCTKWYNYYFVLFVTFIISITLKEQYNTFILAP
jgi:hypothetical protein